MAKGNRRQEFYWDEQRRAWRKRLKNPSTGKWTISVYGATKAELRENIARKQAELAAKAEAAENPRVWEYAREWYALNVVGVAERTKQGYENNIANHICPVIGNMDLASVTADDAARVVAVAAEAGLAKESQKKLIGVMRRIFDAAEESGKIQKNPCKKLKPKGRAPIKKKALTRDQQKTVAEALRGEPIYIFVMLALFCGLRREEALGLKWQDVHFDDDAPWLEICRTCTWPHNQPLVAEYTKSDAGHRRLPIPDALADALRTEPRTCDFVCHTGKNLPYSESAFRRAWEAVTDRTEHTVTYKRRTSSGAWELAEINLKIGDEVPYKGRIVAFDFSFTPHQLRHTYITELIYAGMPLKTVQYLAGHASPDITIAIYTDLMVHAPADTIAGVNDSFKHFRVQASGSDFPPAPENA